MQPRAPYSGYARRRTTSRLVRVSEVLSRVFITLGGLGTIVAVGTVCVFLVWVVVPLFEGTTVKPAGTVPPPERHDSPLLTGVDQYQVLLWAIFPDGTVVISRLDNGHVLEKRPLFPGAHLNCCSAPSRSPEFVFGLADGTIRPRRIAEVTRYLEDDNTLPPALSNLAAGEVAELDLGLPVLGASTVGLLGSPHGLGALLAASALFPERPLDPPPAVVTRISESQLRSQSIKVEWEEPISSADGAGIQLIDQSIQEIDDKTKRPKQSALILLTADGKLRLSSIESRRNVLTKKTERDVTSGELALPPRPGAGRPKYLLISGVGDNVFVAWEDGHLVRINTLNVKEPRIVEEIDLLEKKPGLRLTSLQFLIGKATLLAGDSTGRVRAWFRIRPAGATTSDHAVMAATHEFPGRGAAATAIAVSDRDRMFAVGYADGAVTLFYTTSDNRLADLVTQTGQAVSSLALAPKANGLIAETSGGLWHWDIDEGHPEVNFHAVLRPVWYEGRDAPEHIWQSTGGDDAVEAKFGLWPLIFGTLKATFYSLLIGVPLALLAAVYSSEFLHPSTRAVVKPTIELMASLPSVVLGFLAALILAPFVEKVVPAVVAGFFTIPLAFLVGGFLWQMLPDKTALRLGRSRFAFMCLALPLGVAAAVWLGPLMERLLFNGDIKGWLDHRVGSARSGWLLILFPLSALATAIFLAQVVNPRLRRWNASLSPFANAVADLAKFLTAIVVAVTLAFVLGTLLQAMDLDPRGMIVGTYVQRNTLVVGFMMGFAIIPIIYTIADDALSAVPEHLRSASLGCGATPWQTAVRITIPTALSGLFSAVMIGLGRAVGETMIVLCAAGNTPVLDINIFNGLRTLSANLAVEVPDAARNSTHYRMLFLAALILFGMTFVVNTAAEIIRQRFRKRAYQL